MAAVVLHLRGPGGNGGHGVALFSPVIEIYDRYDRHFVDTLTWRQRRKASNAHLLTLDSGEMTVYPYFFIWNDFAVDQLTPGHCGIKWYRHSDEPEYAYDVPGCHAALETIHRRRLPGVLEEELTHTLYFIQNLADGITVIIPHLGMLNGGYQALAEAGIWSRENVWADTALADSHIICHYLEACGHERLMFGSDFPFGDPADELDKIRHLGLDLSVEAAIDGGNFLRLRAWVDHCRGY